MLALYMRLVRGCISVFGALEASLIRSDSSIIILWEVAFTISYWFVYCSHLQNDITNVVLVDFKVHLLIVDI